MSLSSGTKSKMKLRDDLKVRSKITNNFQNWDDWKRLKNEVNRDIRKEKLTKKENLQTQRKYESRLTAVSRRANNIW